MPHALGASPAAIAILVVAAFWAGAQNALAGGGSFITLPALMLFRPRRARGQHHLDHRALPRPARHWMGGPQAVAGAGGLSFRVLVIISLVGGALGAVLLLATPPGFFARLVPWLVLFAPAVFAWGSFLRRPAETPRRSDAWRRRSRSSASPSTAAISAAASAF